MKKIFKKVNRIKCEGIRCETTHIGEVECVVLEFCKNPKLNTIGCNEGEVVCQAFEYASKRNLPLVAVVASAGMRVTEGTMALMQMVRMVNAVKKHSDKGLLFISVISGITLGGVSASFVALADIIIGEKGAIYGFSGKRIVENTTHEKLPDNFQTVEYAQLHGMLDIVVEKENIEATLSKILLLHQRKRRSNVFK